MAHNKVQFGGGGYRRGTEDTESDYKGMRFEESRPLENFTMNTHPTIKKTTDAGPMSMPPINRKSSTTAMFKVILLGDTLVGKSSILMRLVVSFMIV